jgi:hypothetical protein
MKEVILGLELSRSSQFSLAVLPSLIVYPSLTKIFMFILDYQYLLKVKSVYTYQPLTLLMISVVEISGVRGK